MMTDGVMEARHNKKINKQIKTKGMSEVFRRSSGDIGSASAVRSVKRTAEVVPEERLVAVEKTSSSGSLEEVSESVRESPYNHPPF
jgi:hypothetical protein